MLAVVLSEDNNFFASSLNLNWEKKFLNVLYVFSIILSSFNVSIIVVNTRDTFLPTLIKISVSLTILENLSPIFPRKTIKFPDSPSSALNTGSIAVFKPWSIFIPNLNIENNPLNIPLIPLVTSSDDSRFKVNNLNFSARELIDVVNGNTSLKASLTVSINFWIAFNMFQIAPNGSLESSSMPPNKLFCISTKLSFCISSRIFFIGEANISYKLSENADHTSAAFL